MSLFRVWCGGSFQGSREEDDILWSRRVKSLSMGMPPWFIPAYFKKTQSSKLGVAQGIPFFINNLSGFFSWNYIFIRSHLMYFTWSVCVLLFLFCYSLNKIMLVWERDTLRCCIWTHVFLALLLMFMAKVETASFIVIWLETENAACSNWYNVLNNLILGNWLCSYRSCLSSCIMYFAPINEELHRAC